MIPVPKDAIDEIGRLAAEVLRLHEIVCEQDDMIAELTEQVDYLVGRNEELEEALDMLAITTRKYRSLPRIDGDTIGRLEAELSKALEKARAVLEGDAPKLPDEIESYFRRTLADPAMKRDVKEFVKATRPTAEDMSRRIGDAPKED